MPKQKIIVKNTEIVLLSKNKKNYISLTDIARYKNPKEPKDIVKNWLRNRSTLEFLGLWEKINNPIFKGVEFDSFKTNAGLNSFVLSPKKWIGRTDAIGIISKSGRYGGTFAHSDIAFEFASWISAEFKLYLIKEFQKLKSNETILLKQEWDAKRFLVKANYRVHTDAVQQNLIPTQITKKKANFIYASEADILNIAMFGITAKQWRDKNPDKKGNIRDYVDILQLVCMAGLESLNAEFIRQGLKQSERLRKLNQIAIMQMKALVGGKKLEKLGVK